MRKIYAILLAGVVLVLAFNISSQTTLVGGFNRTTAPIQSPPPDSFVQVAAESQGLSQVAPADLPSGATYWWVMPSGCAVPTPFLPRDLNGPVYQITDAQFLVDTTGGQVALNSHPCALQRQTTANTVATVIAAHADAVVNLINQIQARDAEQQMRSMAMAMGIPSFGGGFGDGGGYSGNGYTNNYVPYTFDTNGLWLGNPTVSNGVSYVNLNNATNQVYAILTTANLLGSWQVETIVWPTNNSVMPFTVQNGDRQILFMRARDWTGVDDNGNGIPDWWEWQYFGTTNMVATNQDFSNNGNTFAQDYSNSVAPTVFSYTGVEVTNNYVSSSQPVVQLDAAGYPYYVATLIDDSNFSNAVWNTYSSSNMTVNLGSVQGWHEVWIGLRGHADNPNSAVWQRKRLKLDWTPPALIITNPTNGTVDVPMIQLQGYSPEALSSISYDLSNATGTVTNQQVLVLNQYYDTTTWEFTTNTFQAFDVVLTNGVNTFTLHATDMAGNTTTFVTNFTLDYSAKTNAPSVQIAWPTNGTEVSGSAFTVDGQVSDPTITVTAVITDTNGNTNTVSGLVERSGKFWVENLPLNSGTNTVTLIVTDAAGNATTNSFNVVQSAVTLTVDPVTPDSQLWQPTVNLTGTISDDAYAVWVNGVKGHNNGDGTWSASNVPVNSGGTASFTATGYAPDEQQPDNSYGN